ncbi:hypothetical protein CDAR_86691 [Caerostris darwini]|uniref:Uncharacterized protein n=1 Tax=Caerostris darwini TaxID=1538125 RepID=A0AAV4VDW7_9ARAC|nr:hypothetical protein CDAR_86691 [Caerostris darwini]
MRSVLMFEFPDDSFGSKVALPGKITLTPEDPAMNATVHVTDFEEILINCRLPSTYTSDCEKTCVQDASTTLS